MKFDLFTITINLATVYIFFYTIFLTIKLFRKYHRLEASKNWPRVTAQIINKKIVCRFSHKYIRYFPQVEYKYSVMGFDITHRSRIDTMINRKLAQKLINTIGDTLEVHYNPEKPNEHTQEFEKMEFLDYSSIIVGLGIGIWLFSMNW